jgi:hypothetical protein
VDGGNDECGPVAAGRDLHAPAGPALAAEPEVAGSVPPAIDPDKDDLAIPDFLDARKRRQTEAVA